MTPANPPPPTPWKRPFHASDGSQTSIVIRGAAMSRTRQCSGSSTTVGSVLPGATAENGPAGTRSIDSMVASGSASAEMRSCLITLELGTRAIADRGQASLEIAHRGAMQARGEADATYAELGQAGEARGV